MSLREISIGLSAWIIQDGNYGDFHVGQKARFAIELHPGAMERTQRTEPFLHHLGGGRHRGRGRVVFASKDAWVLDCGVLAYRDQAPPLGIREGTWMEGELYLEVDPFFYFEGLWKLPGMPALTYDVRIEEILLETTPWRELTVRGRKIRERVAGQVGHASVQQTDAWEDDGGYAEYVLRCSIAGGPSQPPHS
jgi:hypothetical protein